MINYKKSLPWLRVRLMAALALLCITIFGASYTFAVPMHHPVIDGTITAGEEDWDIADLVVDDRDDDVSAPHNVRHLWCTWDSDSLYVGITYQDFETTASLNLYLDLDKGMGVNLASVLDHYPSNLQFPTEHAIELVLGRDAAEGYGGALPTVHLVDDDSGATTDITGLVNMAPVPATKSGEARFPLWNNVEIALPWNVLYPDLDGKVPPLAVIKAVAVITAASAEANGYDSAPSNSGLDGGAGVVLLENLHASIIDANGDGVVDPSSGSINGTIALPGDPGTGTVTVTATMSGFPGRNPGGPLAEFTGEDGVRDFSLLRLPAGTYEVTASATGYFSTAITVEVSAGSATENSNLELEEATSIGGTISFNEVEGGAGTILLKDSSDAIVSSADFSAAGGSYTLYALTSGSYTIVVSAETYMPYTTDIEVTAGQNISNQDITLLRQTEISGTVTFAGGPGAAGTVHLMNVDHNEVDSADFAIIGGTFRFFTITGGDFTLETTTLEPVIYVPVIHPVTVTIGTDVTDIALELPLAALISGTVAFEGPDSPGVIQVFDVSTEVLRDETEFTDTGDSFQFYLPPGNFRLLLTAPGYDPSDSVITVGENDQNLGALQLTAVRATGMVLVDGDGIEIPEVLTTVSTPADDQFFLAPVILAARDDAGRNDLFDLDNNLSGFLLSALKMDDQSAPRGTPVFYGSNDLEDIISTVGFNHGQAHFWMTNDAVEVLRVSLAQPNKAPLNGRIIVAFQDPAPAAVVLTAEADTLVADGVESIVVTASLFDSAQNPSSIPEIPVIFAISPDSPGSGSFDDATTSTNAYGLASAVLHATGSGPLHITCSVVVDNRVLDVFPNELGSDEEFLKLTALAGEHVGWKVNLPANLSDLTSEVTVIAQLVDTFGNPSRVAGQDFTFNADPAGFGSFFPATATSDTNGQARSFFQPEGQAGLVIIGGIGDGTVTDAGLRLRNVFVAPDPIWHDEPSTRQTFAPVDLTALVVSNTPDMLSLEVPFTSDWAGLQMHVLIEKNFDAAGASSDPFEQPVNYGHDHKPDYVLTSKYSVDDYGDLRRWSTSGNEFEYWDLTNEHYTTAAESQNIQNIWTNKTGDNFTIDIPWAALGGQPDSLRFELYLTQDDQGVKRSAFDSAPLDSTLNLTFDYLDPDPGDWETALGPVTLRNWSNTYQVITDFPSPPTVTDISSEPEGAMAGAPLNLRALVTDSGDGIGDVLADLSALGGSPLARMSHEGSGVYTLQTIIDLGNPGGSQEIIVSAFDGGNILATQETTTVVVTPIIEPLISVTDPVGDDHGPNQIGEQGLYYIYPTNTVFQEGAFDLTSLTVYETVVTTGGPPVEMIAFKIGLVDFPDPADPETADWTPLYAKLNIEKIDIFIDSAPGGATATLPNRQAGFQRWDAWDYAIIMDGWYKAVIPSRGQNIVDSWRENAMRTDNDIILVGDPDDDSVTALVSKAALGDPSNDDILKWDICIGIASHDFGGEEVLGGIRWVNEARSEWNFGGGKNGNRDSNYLDLLMVAGSGHNPGLGQEDILNYESPAALARMDEGETPVALEMSAFEDTGPPVIDIGSDGSIITDISPLKGAPLAMTVSITDDDAVSSAIFRYRSTSFDDDGWSKEVPMGFLGRKRWVVDILPSWLEENLVYSPVDSSRYLEFEVYAVDPAGKESTSPVSTLRIAPDNQCQQVETVLDTENIGLLQVDGSALLIPETLRKQFVTEHINEVWTGPEADPDTMASVVSLQWTICDAPGFMKTVATVPRAIPMGVFREIHISTTDSLGGNLPYFDNLPSEFEISLHYPQDWIDVGIDENKLAIYEYNSTTNLWVLIGGNVTSSGNNVTAKVNHTGTYGIFFNDDLNYDPGEVISGILITPNPFSPNGDGLYDEATISFYLTQEATVTVEIFNIAGARKMVLTETYYFSGTDENDNVPHRISGIIWDGKDFAGNYVPYGVYILRVLVTYNQAGGASRDIRSNHSLAVIR